MARRTAPRIHPPTSAATRDPIVAPHRPARGNSRNTGEAAPWAPSRPPARRDSRGPEPTSNTDASTITVRDVLWEDPAAAILRASMAAEIGGRHGDRPLDPIDPDSVAYTAVATIGGESVGHLALRRLGNDVELKRMYVVPEWRRRGVSTVLLHAADAAADRLGAQRIILQAGVWQPDAMRFYRRHGFHEIPLFAPYKTYQAADDARFFAKYVQALAS